MQGQPSVLPLDAIDQWGAFGFLLIGTAAPNRSSTVFCSPGPCLLPGFLEAALPLLTQGYASGLIECGVDCFNQGPVYPAQAPLQDKIVRRMITTNWVRFQIRCGQKVRISRKSPSGPGFKVFKSRTEGPAHRKGYHQRRKKVRLCPLTSLALLSACCSLNSVAHRAH